MPQTFGWDEVSELLDAVMSLPAEARSGYLDGACADPAKRRYLHSLVLAATETAGLLDHWPAENYLLAASPVPEIDAACLGRRIGPYLLIEEIGRGGMGVVFRAIRADDQYLKSVAIKLMKNGAGSLIDVQRFRVERQILASLDHPNIARMLDGGTTEDGSPYVVLELIEGDPIDVYCDDRRLSIDRRLQLFVDVCSAVEFAHQHLVIHRDIKPKNVLVTEDGSVKLLDFGIAKIMDPEAFPQEVEPTLPLMRLLSPEYASPEQVRGDAITTATDVYSLGVLLYELLTGRKPYTFKGNSFSELTSVICGVQPPKPSVIVSRAEPVQDGSGTTSSLISPEGVSEARGGSPAKLRRRLEGDLDFILLKSLRKEPEHRYKSVQHFSDDLQRYLDGFPVSARADTFAYRTGKFVRRYTAAAVATCIVALTLILGIVFTVREAHIAESERVRAERRFDDLRGLAHSNIFELVDAIQQLPGSAAAQHLAVQRSLQYLDRLSQEAKSDITLQQELVAGYEKIGDIQGAFQGAGIGDTQAALNSYDKAIALQTKIVDASGRNFEELQKEALLLRKYSRALLLTGRLTEASTAAGRAVSVAEEALRLRPDDREGKANLALTQLRLAQILGGSGSSGSIRLLQAAIDHDRLAVSYLQQLTALGDERGRQFLGAAHLSLAFHLSKNREFAEAQRVLDEALADEKARHAAPGDTLGMIYNFRGLTHERQGKHLQALIEYRHSLPICEMLKAADPQNLDAQVAEAIARAHIVMQAARLHLKGASTAGVNDAVKSIEQLWDKDPSQTFYLALLVIGYAYQAELRTLDGEHLLAAEVYRKALNVAKMLEERQPDDLESKLNAAKLHLGLAIVLARHQSYTEASREFDASAIIAAKLNEVRPADAEAKLTASAARTSNELLRSCVDGAECIQARSLSLPSLIN